MPPCGPDATTCAGTLLGWLPEDLRGARVLDAGCGTGALSVEAARRGAHVVAIDLSPTLIELARERLPHNLGLGAIEFHVGDMLDATLGRFDYVVAMDSLIHYRPRDTVRVLEGLAAANDTFVAVYVCPAHGGTQRYAWRRPAVPACRSCTGDRTGPPPNPEPVDPVRYRGLGARSNVPHFPRLLHFPGAGGGSPVSAIGTKFARTWTHVGTRFLPFADAATPELPLGRLLRLSLFQVSVGLAVVLLIGTLNRVMIVELGVPAWLVAVMISLPLVFAPFRALVGFRSDTHRSVLGWRRVPYIWMGTLIQFGGLAIMPFALIVLSGDTNGPIVFGQIGAALSFLLVGAGLHTTQTVGLALATDLAPPESFPKVVALLCMMLLLGMVGGALTYGALLAHFTEIKLIQVIQGTALATMLLNIIALWKQEARDPSLTARDRLQPTFKQAWATFSETPKAKRRLFALGLGTVAFSMQDILLEPYGGQVLHLTVGTTTILSALLATGGLSGFGVAARLLGRGTDPYRLAAVGSLVGLVAFSAVIFAAPLDSILLFAIGTALIGFGAGLFGHCTLTAAMGTARTGQIGLALGVWGAVQASAAGSAVAAGGLIRDGISFLAANGVLGQAMNGPATGYSFVYHIEIYLLFATLIAIGPLVRRPNVDQRRQTAPGFSLGELPSHSLSLPR